MKSFNPYLNFQGNCEEALSFYKDCMNGEIVSKMYFSDTEIPVPAGYEKKIMHAEFKAGSVYFMASDVMPNHPLIMGNNISLSIDFTDVNTQKTIFDKLAVGATIIMPLQDTFWGAKFGILTDKFGISWMFNCDVKE